MEFTCKKCGLTCCGTPMGTEQICEDCFDKLHKDNMGVNIKEDKGMKFIDAIGKYEAITRDGGTTVYSKNSEGNIIRKTNGIGGGFQLNYGLLVSTGWVEHQEHKLILPERVDYSHRYMHIGGDNSKVYVDSDCRFDEDADRLKTFNYFTDKEFAQYIADRQLLDRIELVLYKYNNDKMDDKTLTKLINEYIDTHYAEVLNRVLDYQDRM